MSGSGRWLVSRHVMSSSVDQLFTEMKRRLDRELRYMENSLELLSCRNRDEEKISKVEHRVVQISWFVEK